MMLMLLAVAIGLVAYLLLLCLLILLQDFRRWTNIALAAFSVLLVAWLMSIYLLQSPIGESITYTRIVFVLGLWATGALAWFTCELASEVRTSPVTRRTLGYGLILYAAMSVMALVSPFIIADLQINPGRVPVPVYGPGYWLYVLLVALSVGAIILWIIRGYHYAAGLMKRQLRTVSWTLGIAVFVAFMTNIVIPLLTGNTQSALLFPAAVAIMIGGLSYAIARNGLLDIKAATVRSVVYALSILTMAGIYFSLAYIASITFFNESVTTGVSLSPINVALALILAFIFQPVRQFFDRVTDKVFYRDRYDPNTFITQLGNILTRVTDLTELLERADTAIATTLKASSSLFVIYRENAADAIVGSLDKHFFDAEYELLRQVAGNLPDEASVVNRLLPVTTDIRRLQVMLAAKHVSVIIPLRSGEATIGYLLLGEQLSGGYARQDIEVLETIRGELVIAIQNARSVQEVRDLNTTLEQKVNDATRELRASNKRLLELDAMKDEFVSMASHQLRTPLTSVKGYISMVLEGDAGKISKPQRQLLQEAFTSSERMVHLISDFLNVSRLQTGKFVVDRKLVDLAEITKQEVANIGQIAVSHQVRVEYRKPSHFPALYLDEGKIRQVIMNFIDNAIYYSPDSKLVKVTLAIEDGDAVLRVIDKGMGVPDEAQKKLFTKFFRAENARKQRPDGTGVGLFLAKKVIVGHGGSLVFESTLGKGSTFGFRLPVRKLSLPPAPEEQEAAVTETSA